MTQLPELPADRRAVLRGTGLTARALGGGGLLAACAGEDAPGPGAQPGSDGTTGSPSSSAPGAQPGSGSPSVEQPDPEPTEAEQGGVQVAAAEVPVGGGVILPDADYVVTQPSAGEFRAFSKICTHAGCPVSEVVEAQIVCFCHGSAFAIADGSVQQGPATQPLAETPVTADGDQLRIG